MKIMALVLAFLSFPHIAEAATQTITISTNPVTQITAGTGITISPTSGKGNVTVNAAGGGHTISTYSAEGISDFTARTKLAFDNNYFIATDSASWNASLISLRTGVVSDTYSWRDGTSAKSLYATTINGTEFGGTVTGSTRTFTTNGSQRIRCHAGGSVVNDNINGRPAILGLLVDGVATNTLQRVDYIANYAGNYLPFGFSYTTDLLSAGQHSVALTAKIVSGGTNLIVAYNDYGFFYCDVSPQTTPAISVPASSFTTVTSGDYALTNGYWSCVPGSTITLTTNGGDLQVNLVASALNGTIGGTNYVGPMVDGIMTKWTKEDFATANYDYPMGGSYLFTGLSAGAHSVCAAGKYITSSGSLRANSGAPLTISAHEVRNVAGTGDVASNGNNTFTGTNNFTGTVNLGANVQSTTMTYLNLTAQPFFRSRRSTAQNVKTGVETIVYWDSPMTQRAIGWVNTSSGSITIANAGAYQIDTGACFQTLNTGYGVLRIYIGASELAEGWMTPDSAVATLGCGHVSIAADLNAGDVVQARVVHGTGTDEEISADFSRNYISIYKVQ